jgi:hypothetical protein
MAPSAGLSLSSAPARATVFDRQRNHRGDFRSDRSIGLPLIGNQLLVLFSPAMNAPTCEVNESTVCPVGSSLWL